MKMKYLTNQLNNQKGITAADVAIAMLIILTAVGVIVVTYMNLTVNSISVDRKTGATRIATNILENISLKYYDELDSELLLNGASDVTGNVTTNKIYGTSIPNGYHVNITFNNSYGESNSGLDLVKIANVDVTYNVNGKQQSVRLSKVFKRETIRECNSPNFSDEYIENLSENNLKKFSGAQSDFNSTEFIICPIKYNASQRKYELVVDTDKLWYSYSSKQWARIVIIPSDSLTSAIQKIGDVYYLSETGLNYLTNPDLSYVWIPRFGIQNGKELYNGALFRYKTTDGYGIDFVSENQFSYHKLIQVLWSQNYASISFVDSTTGNALLGKWCKISDLSNNQTVAYYLNQSRFGPMTQY